MWQEHPQTQTLSAPLCSSGEHQAATCSQTRLEFPCSPRFDWQLPQPIRTQLSDATTRSDQQTYEPIRRLPSGRCWDYRRNNLTLREFRGAWSDADGIWCSVVTITSGGVRQECVACIYMWTCVCFYSQAKNCQGRYVCPKSVDLSRTQRSGRGELANLINT